MKFLYLKMIVCFISVLMLGSCAIEVKKESNKDIDINRCSGGVPVEEIAKNTKLYQLYTDCILTIEKRKN